MLARLFGVLVFLFIVVGGLNWGLIGFFNFDLIAAIFGGGDQRATFPRVIYAIVGLATLWFLFALLFSLR
ncbi:MAG: DUF378 domain-containing protein [Actinobacteria bacterium]|nr:DUF378 domain-containing protein [Actinomycetota bacterium]